MSEQLAAPDGQPTEKGETEYVVLERALDDGAWRVVASSVSARGAQAAIVAFGNAPKPPDELIGSTGTTLVAVPARSWKPVRVKPKTVTTLVIEEA